MKLYKLENVKKIPISMAEAWDFFSDPLNLKKITPRKMFKKFYSEQDKKMYEGMIIQYDISAIPLISQTWVTEITTVKENEFFIDEQRFGPYKFWHHQHFFKEINNGVEIYDIVHYALPFGFIGRIANNIFVKGKLKQIFDYRNKKIEEIFGIYE